MATGIGDLMGSAVPIRERTDLTYLLLDGLRRPGGRKSKDAILCALAMTKDGSLVPLAMRPVARETEPAWRAFLTDLKARGVGRELQLICCDDHPALAGAVGDVFPHVPVQISVAHRLLTLARKVDPAVRAACLAAARQIFTAKDLDTAVARFRLWRAEWGRHGHRAVNSLAADLASCLTFYRFPSSVWPKIRTVNLVEREFRQARRSAPPAPADETEQLPGAGTTGAPEAEAPASAQGPGVDDRAHAADPVLNGRARRHQAVKAWTPAPLAMDRLLQSDAATDTLMAYHVPVSDAPTSDYADAPPDASDGVDEPAAMQGFGGEEASVEEASLGEASVEDEPVGTTDYPFSPAHAHDLTQDADFMWWLRQHRQSQGLPLRTVAVATIVGGLLTGVLLARVL